jgi:hypothetical protein
VRASSSSRERWERWDGRSVEREEYDLKRRKREGPAQRYINILIPDAKRETARRERGGGQGTCSVDGTQGETQSKLKCFWT